MQIGAQVFFGVVVTGLGGVAGATVPGLPVIQGYPGYPGYPPHKLWLWGAIVM